MKDVSLDMSEQSFVGMVYGPYSTRSELPASVRRRLTLEAQEVFREAYNRCVATYQDVEHGRRMAWAAVERGFRETQDGTWVRRTGDPETDQAPAEFFQPRRRRAG